MSKEDALSLVQEKFKELQELITKRLELEAEYRDSLKSINARMLAVNGQLSMAITIAKSK